MINKALHNLFRFGVNALALYSVLTFAVYLMGQVVWFMTPVGWCQGPGYIEARFQGYKVINTTPVRGSWVGRGLREGLLDDVVFEFRGDLSPGDSKALGWNDFGIWRWYGTELTSVSMTMQHTDGLRTLVTRFGPYEISPSIPSCPIERSLP